MPQNMTPEQFERYIKTLDLLSTRMDRLITAITGLSKKLDAKK
jgi:hypothetical protein